MIFPILTGFLLLFLIILPFVKFFIPTTTNEKSMIDDKGKNGQSEWPMFAKIEPIFFTIAMFLLVWCFSHIWH